ncbi:sensor histidine kinase [Solimonas terrae]|uniref:histidine kinase n=1 Tax=Solimonas terrae TaxID=1396819 RepID=A0A6M2BPP0_9GAMM|nr:ATP-binding protein [Solimonas terrae]NGY04165.1 ATP-binding protein [Solimonas terrae]
MRPFSLQARLSLVFVIVSALAAMAAVLVAQRTASMLLAALAATAVALLAGSWLAHQLVQPLERLLRALEGAVASFRDGDFSFSIADDRRGPLGALTRLHNALGQTLREQRQHLTQRELLLDTVVQNTPTALVLVDDSGHVAYANLAARQLFNDNRSLAGMSFEAIVASGPASMREALAEGGDALFSVDFSEGEETFHLSQRGFRLQGRGHRLYLFRRMTRELSRQEVATWKKVIRVMSHELNNSLAPISSLAHSGGELARRGQTERLPDVFASIGGRAKHLHSFIESYATFARLPAPRPEAVVWQDLVSALRLQAEFRVAGSVPDGQARFDRAQIEQVLINLLKNAHEAGSDADAVELEVRRVAANWRVEVRDRGSGMSETVLANALLPFYSTKRAGTGLGLALAREIAEAHGGRLQLANRDGGGLRVSLMLPA